MLALSIIGALKLVAPHLKQGTLDRIDQKITDAAGHVLNQSTIHSTLTPMLNDLQKGGGLGVTAIGLVVMLWSGSRWLNVYVDTITIMYGLNGRRHFLKTRALSFLLYLVMLLVSTLLLPLLVVGPDWLGNLFQGAAKGAVNASYWPVVVAVSIVFLTTLYHVSVPVRTPWRRDLPGAFLALVIWVVGSMLLRLYLDTSVDRNSAYGSLAAPIAILFWLYVTALAVLIGAGLNAVVDRTWPIVPTAEALEKAAALQPVQESRLIRPLRRRLEAMEESAPVLEPAPDPAEPSPQENPVTTMSGRA
jgi:membrane protein